MIQLRSSISLFHPTRSLSSCRTITSLLRYSPNLSIDPGLDLFTRPSKNLKNHSYFGIERFFYSFNRSDRTKNYNFVKMSSKAANAEVNSDTNVTWETPLPEDQSKIFTYLVNAPDVETGSNRQQLRSQHVEVARKGLKSGRIINGGACLETDPPISNSSSTNPNPMKGSWLLIRACSLKEARQMCLNDIYITGGAWDKDKLLIQPVINLV
ncbi:expressed protein [Phakopsora pachyrhizi]|uniref:Expressed protein n=1 Tax=Phakopsora pachyrhizi TaxID=170000 RepID=A0AAV0AZJ4_PHAPC|nr:expressed protein [Phakopsora pachyrhizi]